MPSELEELVEFLHDALPQVRLTAAANMVGYTLTDPAAFKRKDLEAVKDLKKLVSESNETAKPALEMLINLSRHQDVVSCLADDDTFIQTLMSKIIQPKEPHADLIAMLFSNLTKSKSMLKLLTFTPQPPPDNASTLTSTLAIDQLLDLFVKGVDWAYNGSAQFDYLGYVFADLAMHPDGQDFFLLPKKEADGSEEVIPLSKIMIFSEHQNPIRRQGVASAIKNLAFDLGAHDIMLAPSEEGQLSLNLLPYILLPLMGAEEYDELDTDGMLPEIQMLGPDKKRETDTDILETHLDTLLLLTTTRPGRERLRELQVYPIIRNLHLYCDDDDVREACDRFVQITMRGEEGREKAYPLPWLGGEAARLGLDSSDEDDEIIQVA